MATNEELENRLDAIENGIGSIMKALKNAPIKEEKESSFDLDGLIEKGGKIIMLLKQTGLIQIPINQAPAPAINGVSNDLETMYLYMQQNESEWPQVLSNLIELKHNKPEIYEIAKEQLFQLNMNTNGGQ